MTKAKKTAGASAMRKKKRVASRSPVKAMKVAKEPKKPCKKSSKPGSTKAKKKRVKKS